MLLSILLAPIIALLQTAPPPTVDTAASALNPSLGAPALKSDSALMAVISDPSTSALSAAALGGDDSVAAALNSDAAAAAASEALTDGPASGAWRAGPTSSDPGFQARLYAAQSSVQPGKSVEVAIELRFAPGWHIYHPLILDTGYATTIKFDTPGVSADKLRFPVPEFDTDTDGGVKQEYLGLESPVVVLTKLHVAPDTPPGPLTVKATVGALACKAQCVPVNAEATLDLPVSADASLPANEKLFQDARRALPQPLEQADYVTGSRVLASHTKIPAGGRGTIIAAIHVKPGHHIQDHNPGVEGLIPTRLYIEHAGDAESLKLFDQAWPQPRVREDAGGKVRELAGDFFIRVPFEVEKDAKPGPKRLRAMFHYQTCADKGTCYAANMAEAAVEFKVVPTGAPAVANTDPIVAKADSAPTAVAASPAAGVAGRATPNLLLVFLAAFVGGMILNVMPCVLPVISLKIFGFVQQAHDDRGRIFRMGLAYTCGILASFLLLAILMIYAGLAWGGLMQRPEFLIGLAAVVFAFALSLLGVYEINLPGAATSMAGEVAAHGGYGGAFMNGVFATLLATPCVAPFLGSAVGVLTQLPNPYIGGAGIMVVGAGLATPYLLLTAFPGWLKFLPKPGPWMVTFKQIVGFILLVVVVWLLSVLLKMIDQRTFEGTLGLLCAVGAGAWTLGRIRLGDSRARWASQWMLALALAGGGGWLSYWAFSKGVERIPWQKWTEPGIGERLAAQGNTVFVDYTAAWCVTCISNEAGVLNTEAVAGEFSKLGVYPIRADFTTRDPKIQEELRKYGRTGVPTYVVIPAEKPDSPVVLWETLTKDAVVDALKRAGPSRQRPEFWSAPP
jgi:thiol:disulfide interchange protein